MCDLCAKTYHPVCGLIWYPSGTVLWDVVNKSAVTLHLTKNLRDFNPLKLSPLPAKSPSFFILCLQGSYPIPCITPVFPECSTSNPFILHQRRDRGCRQCSSTSPNLQQGLGLRVPSPTSCASFFPSRAWQVLSSVQAITIDLIYSLQSLELSDILCRKFPQCHRTTMCSHVLK